MMVESYRLQLNRTHLLLIHPLDLAYDPNSSGTVVQVCLRGNHDAEENISNTFSVKQASITIRLQRTIETLLSGHVNAPHELPRRVIVQDVVSGHALVGVRKTWKYGQGKQFFFGDDTLEPAEHKWIFHLEAAR